MITRSEDYVEYCRELAKNLRDVQDLALRGKNKRAITRRIHEDIVNQVSLHQETIWLTSDAAMERSCKWRKLLEWQAQSDSGDR